MKLIIFSTIAIIASALTDETRTQRTPWLVELNQGPVRGYKEGDNKFYNFYGIPYATAPTGTHKFKAPLPAPKWTDTLEATNRFILCPQPPIVSLLTKDKHNIIYTENCLNVNIYVPDEKKTNLPVLVYVHGGGFQIGFGEMMSHIPLVETGKVIVVNFNYRLGVQGFLCLGTEDIPGNAGMKDQVAALRWVRDNIGKFGGNPNDVTLAGGSAGAAAVELLMLSEPARGLFNKVIPESGSAISPWSIQVNPIENARRMAVKQNYTNADNIYELEKFYKTISLEVFNNDDFLNIKDSTFEYVPCVERSTSEESFLLDTPFNILKYGNFNKVPILIGFAKHEGMIRLPTFDTWSVEMNNAMQDFLPASLKFEDNKDKVKVAEEIKHFYFGDKAIDNKTMPNYVDYFSDVMFKIPTMRMVDLYLKAGGKFVYLYEFSYIDKMVYVPNFIVKEFSGANHCSQSAMLATRNIFLNAENLSEEHIRMRKIIVDLWINFITNGKPVLEKNTMFPSGWPEATLEDLVYMDISTEPKLRQNLSSESFQFWNEIYGKYYRYPVPPQLPKRTEL